MAGQERRFTFAQVRDSQGDEGAMVYGRAASYHCASGDLGGFREIIKRGAFASAIKRGDDVRFLVNHEPSQILGRTKNGSLKLQDAKDGLHFACALPATALGRDIRTLCALGTMDECSFGFVVGKGNDSWHDSVRAASKELGEDIDGEYDSKTPCRVIHDFAKLTDCSVVTYPAYDSAGATQAFARCVQQFPDGALESMPVEVRSRITRALAMAPSVQALRARQILVECVMGTRNPDAHIDNAVIEGHLARARALRKRSK
jgi:HK97 family phage prohead protease